MALAAGVVAVGIAGAAARRRCVTTLRAKIEPDPHCPIHIHTLRDVGYRFEPPKSE